jgi:GNAT superfamily N-acetyltransferase
VCPCESENKHGVRFFQAYGMTIDGYCFSGSSAPQKEFVPKDGSAATKITMKHVTNDAGEMSAEGEALLRSAQRVHRQLRMALPEGSDEYVSYMRDVFADGGRMVVGLKADGTAVGVGVYRFYYDFAVLRQRNWVDDLVSDSTQRSLGVGHAVMDEIRSECRKRGVDQVQLDSGVHRRDAHRFYFREAMVIHAFSLDKPVSK